MLRRRLSHVIVPSQQRVKVGVGQACCAGGLLLLLDGQGDGGVLQRRLGGDHGPLAQALDLQLIGNLQKAL